MSDYQIRRATFNRNYLLPNTIRAFSAPEGIVAEVLELLKIYTFRRITSENIGNPKGNRPPMKKHTFLWITEVRV